MDDDSPSDVVADDLAQVSDLLRRVVGARVRDAHVVEDVVQEALARLMAASSRLDSSALAPYAVVTAQNLLTSLWRGEERSRRNAHRLVDDGPQRGPEDNLLLREQTDAVVAALSRLSFRERSGLVAHEVEGRPTAVLADEWGSTPGAVAAQLSRARAKLRVEYLLTVEGDEPPTDRCRPVLLALSTGERRRQRELDVGYHLLECDFCGRLAAPLLDRRQEDRPGEIRVAVEQDADVVAARQRARTIATAAGCSPTEVTLVATAVSEVARNIVQFAKRGEIAISRLDEGGRAGITVVARDAGPGIADLEEAQLDGYSTYGGMGLGLGGCRRLMDEFDITSEVDRGTTLVMTKWCK